MLYEKLASGRVRCDLCEHRCVIADGEWGRCQVRKNRNGTLYTVVYGRAIWHEVDRVENKPLFHFWPGSTTYSIGTAGCNFHCRWCRNWSISQSSDKPRFSVNQMLSPTQVVAAALRANCQSIAFTYTEPTVFFECAYDTARLGHEAGLANTLATNGYISGDALEAIRGYLDAVNVDLKAFRDDTYRQYTGGRLKPVLSRLAAIARLGIWLEVTTPIVPGVNDDREELKDIAAFVANELGVDTPWHIGRFFPAYKMANRPPTPLATLHRARDIGYEAGLRYVYVGNTSEEQNTLCHHCGHLLVRRDGNGTVEQSVQADGRCPSCGTRAAGLWTREGLDQ